MYPNAIEDTAEAAFAAVFMKPNTAPAFLRPTSRHTAQRFGCWARIPAYASDRNTRDQTPLVVTMEAVMNNAAKPSLNTPSARRPVFRPNRRTSRSLAKPPIPFAQPPTRYGSDDNTSAASVYPRPF